MRVAIGGILEYAQIEGFLKNRGEFSEQCNSEDPNWEAFLGPLDAAFQGSVFTVAEVWKLLNASNNGLSGQDWTGRAQEIRNALPGDLMAWVGVEGKFQQRLGIAFNARRSRRFGERQLRVERETDDAHNKVGRWKIVAGA